MSRAQWNMPSGALLGVKALAEMTNATENVKSGAACQLARLLLLGNC